MARLAALPRPERPGVRWTRPEQWHVTLRFFGELSVDEVVTARRSMAAGVAGARPVAAVVGPEVRRLGRRVLQVPVGGLEPLAAALAASTAGVGASADRPFVGHLTLARGRDDHSLDGLGGAGVHGQWEVRDVALVASVASPRRGVPNRYEVVATFALD
ncbi:MAG TPA: 2'-5' RNA ligase family protein [Acidimicrobiales bacterium]|nr:2'-5' RNA ligase family protein [Acidimicrobiales bacterium]